MTKLIDDSKEIVVTNTEKPNILKSFDLEEMEEAKPEDALDGAFNETLIILAHEPNYLV